jgi:hypothetical protein
MKLGLSAVLLVGCFVAVGCAAPDSEEVAGAEGALHSATDCPAAIEVEVQKPTIMSDAKLLSVYKKDFEKQGLDDHAAEYAEDQLTQAAELIAQARADKAVSLRGVLQQGCAYKTFDAKTGQLSDYHVWLSSDGSSLRISQSSDRAERELFMSAGIKTLSQTALVLKPKDATVYAEDTSTGHDGSDGWSSWIGYAKVTAKASQ